MGATLSQPFIPLLPRSIKTKSKRPRFRFRLRIRWKRKITLSEIRALFPNPGHDHREYRESKLYDSSSTEGEEKSCLSDSYTFTSASSTGPVPTLPVAEKAPGAGLSSLNEPPGASGTLPSSSTSSSTSPRHPVPVSISKEKPLPNPSLELVCPADPIPRQQTQTNTSSELPATEVIQATNTSVEDAKQEDDDETEHGASDSDFPPERPHTPPPWDTSLAGYGSVLEVSRPFRARRVFEHPLVEGHFLGNKGDCFLGGGGPIAAEEKRRMWRVWESAKGEGKGECNGVNKREKEGREKGEKKGLKSRGGNAIERERGNRKEKSKKTTKRMSEWRKWKPLPKYPACTGVAQRASTWAATGDTAWIEVVEEAEDQQYQGGDEKEEEEDEDEDDDKDDEDLEEAIKRFLEMKIPVDLSSLRRLRTSFAGTGEHTTTADSGTGEAAGGEAGEEDLEKAMEGEQGQSSPLVESLMFADTDIEGFEFLFEEEDEGGGIWDSGIVVGVESGRVDGKGEVCKMSGPIGGFAGGGASRAEVSEEDAGHIVRRAFSVTQRLSRWKERK